MSHGPGINARPVGKLFALLCGFVKLLSVRAGEIVFYEAIATPNAAVVFSVHNGFEVALLNANISVGRVGVC